MAAGWAVADPTKGACPVRGHTARREVHGRSRWRWARPGRGSRRGRCRWGGAWARTLQPAGERRPDLANASARRPAPVGGLPSSRLDPYPIALSWPAEHPTDMRFSINIPNFGDFADPRNVATVAA